MDLFAGPGGLSEGFACAETQKGRRMFKTVVSIEHDNHAHSTLTLRHFFRSFNAHEVPDSYYEYLARQISKNELIRRYPVEWKKATNAALNISLGKDDHTRVKSVIEAKVKAFKKWVLMGGPPCQAYSLMGRSRMAKFPEFDQDERHFLYKEYLRIIADHRPPVFVMENVKGLLSSSVAGERIVSKILRDLTHPSRATRRGLGGLKYRLFSLNGEQVSQDGSNSDELVVRSEDYGVPQARHRVFILGIRSDLEFCPSRLTEIQTPTVSNVIGNMPRLRSRISKLSDSTQAWRTILASAPSSEWFEELIRSNHGSLATAIQNRVKKIEWSPKHTSSNAYRKPKCLASWYYDSRLKSCEDHESRSHMSSDIQRYFFASEYARVYKRSPNLSQFPKSLLPNHRNANASFDQLSFTDRFRVQLGSSVASTITSHISKDGHYYIHYDPRQCRSLTVREAARLQTFPDNYIFEGPRTAQFHQIGNAVPPLLAYHISYIVKEILDAFPD